VPDPAAGEGETVRWQPVSPTLMAAWSSTAMSVTVGLSQVRRVPGAKSKQPPARTLLECLRHREADVLRFLTGR
jgi:hypothetical protein